VGIIGSNFRGQSLDFNLVLFGFILQVKELLVVSGGHWWRGTKEGKWDHGKKSENDIYECVQCEKRNAMR
jgi:hypothetical protein